jgi:chaperonin GroEL
VRSVFNRAAATHRPARAGGVALIRAQKALDKLEGANEGQTVGIRILSRSIEEPLRQVVENAALVAGLLLTTEVMIAEAPKEEEHSHGGAPGGMGGKGGMDM